MTEIYNKFKVETKIVRMKVANSVDLKVSQMDIFESKPRETWKSYYASVILLIRPRASSTHARGQFKAFVIVPLFSTVQQTF